MSRFRQARRGEVSWLNAADQPDERYLVMHVLETYAAMRKLPMGSREWERMSAKHDALLDVIALLFKLRGKFVAEAL